MASPAFLTLTPLPLSRRAAPLAQQRKHSSATPRLSAPPRCASITPPRAPAVPAGAKRPRAAPKLVAEGDDLSSTPKQRALVAAFAAATAALPVKLALSGGGIGEVAAIAASFVFTDLAVGIYHHAVDNYGSAKTPILGYQIAAFQGHHDFPWTITSRDLANNLYRLTIPTLPQILIADFLLPSTPGTAFYASFLVFIVLSQEAHRQAHLTRAAGWVRALQNAGLLVRQTTHAAHHRAPFEGNYCILSGWWNGPLDRSLFFRRLEAVVFRLTGVEPLCWGADKRLKEVGLASVPDLLPWRK